MQSQRYFREPYIRYCIWLIQHGLCTKTWQDIHHWIDNSTINIFYLNVILKCEPYHFKYNTIHVKYVTTLWHVGGAILIQIGSAMCHWIRLLTSTKYYY
jgi:hypothetical protein